MKPTFTIYLIFLISTLIGCSRIEDSISVEEASQLVIEEHTNGNGTPSIVSVETKQNEYHIKWENKENKESGTDIVNNKGEITMSKVEIE